MGFCYGGGKALAYSTSFKKAKATVVVYGKPVRFYSLKIYREGFENHYISTDFE